MSGYASGVEYRTCGQFVYRSWKQSQRYAFQTGNHDAYGGGFAAGGSAEPDFLGD